MSIVRVTISPELFALPARIERELDLAHERGAAATVNEIRHQIIRSDTVATKGLLNSIDKQFERRGRIRAWLAGSVLNYSPFPEKGRKAGGVPPVDAILRWIVFKGVTPRDPKMKLRSLAFLIARQIGRKGYKGRYPFRSALQFATPQIDAIFDQAIDRLQREIGL